MLKVLADSLDFRDGGKGGVKSCNPGELEKGDCTDRTGKLGKEVIFEQQKLSQP